MSGHFIRIVSLLAVDIFGLLSLTFAARAQAVDNITAVQCIVQSANLNFGVLSLRRPLPLAGEGEVRLVCQNMSPQNHRITVLLAFPTMGSQTSTLLSVHGSLAVVFYQDAQHVMRWGDDLNGASAMHIPLELGPSERKQLDLPVYALLYSLRSVVAGVYRTQIPITVTTLQK